MKLEQINKEFDKFFEFPTEDRLQVSSTSCKLFADYIATKAVYEFKAGLVPVMWWSGDSDYPDDVMLPSIRQSLIDRNSSMYLDYLVPLYALGETK